MASNTDKGSRRTSQVSITVEIESFRIQKVKFHVQIEHENNLGECIDENSVHISSNKRAKMDNNLNDCSKQLNPARAATVDPKGPLENDPSPSNVVLIPSVGSVTSKSQGIPLSRLFEALLGKVSPDIMKMVCTLYESFRGKKVTKGEFIKELRSIIGDEMLRSAISSLLSPGLK